MEAGAECSQSRDSLSACPGAQDGLQVCPRNPLLCVLKVLTDANVLCVDPDVEKVGKTSQSRETKLELAP